MGLVSMTDSMWVPSKSLATPEKWALKGLDWLLLTYQPYPKTYKIPRTGIMLYQQRETNSSTLQSSVQWPVWSSFTNSNLVLASLYACMYVCMCMLCGPHQWLDQVLESCMPVLTFSPNKGNYMYDLLQDIWYLSTPKVLEFLLPEIHNCPPTSNN